MVIVWTSQIATGINSPQRHEEDAARPYKGCDSATCVIPLSCSRILSHPIACRSQALSALRKVNSASDSPSREFTAFQRIGSLG